MKAPHSPYRRGFVNPRGRATASWRRGRVSTVAILSYGSRFTALQATFGISGNAFSALPAFFQKIPLLLFSLLVQFGNLIIKLPWSRAVETQFAQPN